VGDCKKSRSFWGRRTGEAEGGCRSSSRTFYFKRAPAEFIDRCRSSSKRRVAQETRRPDGAGRRDADSRGTGEEEGGEKIQGPSGNRENQSEKEMPTHREPQRTGILVKDRQTYGREKKLGGGSARIRKNERSACLSVISRQGGKKDPDLGPRPLKKMGE